LRNKFRIISRLFGETHGQDLAEYCLITAFIAVAACAIYFNVAGGVQNIWQSANTTLVSRSSQTGAPSTGSPTTGTGSPTTHDNVPGSTERGSEKNDR
jgi:Flp pilus assembly pilin Flp